jgi:hypothetical protein
MVNLESAITERELDPRISKARGPLLFRAPARPSTYWPTPASTW